MKTKNCQGKGFNVLEITQSLGLGVKSLGHEFFLGFSDLGFRLNL